MADKNVREVIIGNNSAAHGAYSGYVTRGSSDHFICVFANGKNFAGIVIYGNYVRFVEDNSAAGFIYNYLGCTEIYSNICRHLWPPVILLLNYSVNPKSFNVN